MAAGADLGRLWRSARDQFGDLTDMMRRLQGDVSH